MSEFINTIEVLGDEATMDAIIERTITEFKDDILTEIGTYAFYGCTDLTTVDLPNVEKIADSVFEECSALTTVNLPSLTSTEMKPFYGCSALTKVKLPSLTFTKGYLFWGCSSLSIVDFSKPVKFQNHMAFAYCPNLIALIFRCETLSPGPNPSNFSTDSGIHNGTGYIYVPRALVDQYKSATNWSVYADQFRALEDYTVDGTTTGELDESKI